MTDSTPISLTPAALLAHTLGGRRDVIAVTGATGWFGSVAMDLLYAALGGEAPDRVVGYATRYRQLVVADGRTARIRPLGDLVDAPTSPSMLLHFAFLPRDRIAELGVDAYVSQSITMTTTVLDAIAVHRPRQVVVSSSGAARPLTGNTLAVLPHHPYGTLKRLDELALRAATHEVGGCCVIPRVFSVGGSRIARPDVFALAGMIGMARAGGPIDVRARGPAYRTYCGVDEIVALSIWAAVSGHDTTFDTCGTVVEMGELAHVVAQEHGLAPDAVHRTWDAGAPADRYVGDGRVMESLAARAMLHLRPLDVLVRASSASVAARV